MKSLRKYCFKRGNNTPKEVTDNSKSVQVLTKKYTEEEKQQNINYLREVPEPIRYKKGEKKGWVISNSSSVYNGEEQDGALYRKIVFPEIFFEEQIELDLIETLNGSTLGEEKYRATTTWMSKIDKKIVEMNEIQMEAFLSDYFDNVINNLNNAQR